MSGGGNRSETVPSQGQEKTVAASQADEEISVHITDGMSPLSLEKQAEMQRRLGLVYGHIPCMMSACHIAHGANIMHMLAYTLTSMVFARFTGSRRGLEYTRVTRFRAKPEFTRISDLRMSPEFQHTAGFPTCQLKLLILTPSKLLSLMPTKIAHLLVPLNNCSRADAIKTCSR